MAPMPMRRGFWLSRMWRCGGECIHMLTSFFGVIGAHAEGLAGVARVAEVQRR